MHASSMQLQRCLLFVPGARADRFSKACDAGADQVCIDLEDTVGLADKVTARAATFDFIAQYKGNKDNKTQLGVRINCISSDLGVADITDIAARNLQPAFIMLPKVESPADIAVAQQILGAELCAKVPLIAQLESPHAVFEARAIAKAATNLQALMFGGFDYAVAARVTPGYNGWLWARGQIAAAAAEAEVGALDVPCLDINNAELIARETAAVIELGYTGKAAIHPAQIAAIQNAFLPTRAQAAHAQKVLDAVATSPNAAIAVDGKLVDRPIELAAQRVAQLALLGVRD